MFLNFLQANYEEDLKKATLEKENRRQQEVSRHHRQMEMQSSSKESEKHLKNVESKVLEEKKLRFLEQQKQPEERYRPTTPKVRKF